MSMCQKHRQKLTARNPKQEKSLEVIPENALFSGGPQITVKVHQIQRLPLFYMLIKKKVK